VFSLDFRLMKRLTPEMNTKIKIEVLFCSIKDTRKLIAFHNLVPTCILKHFKDDCNESLNVSI
jgi:hypothetical protein